MERQHSSLARFPHGARKYHRTRDHPHRTGSPTRVTTTPLVWRDALGQIQGGFALAVVGGDLVCDRPPSEGVEGLSHRGAGPDALQARPAKLCHLCKAPDFDLVLSATWLALLGQRRGQRSALRYLRLP
jgi:hypothetical protein